MRAVESGRYVVRAANTGISTVISQKGQILSSTPALTEGYSTAEISFFTEKTVFTRTGNLIVLLCCLYLDISLSAELFFASGKKTVAK